MDSYPTPDEDMIEYVDRWLRIVYEDILREYKYLPPWVDDKKFKKAIKQRILSIIENATRYSKIDFRYGSIVVDCSKLMCMLNGENFDGVPKKAYPHLMFEFPSGNVLSK